MNGRGGDDEFSVTGIAWSIVKWPFSTAYQAGTTAVSQVAHKATQVPGKVMDVASSAKQRILPSHNPDNYRQLAEDVRKKQEERKRVELARKMQEAKSPQRATETTPLLAQNPVDALAALNDLVLPDISQSLEAASPENNPPQDEAFTALLTRMDEHRQKLDTTVGCYSMFAERTQKKSAALTRITAAKNWLELKIKAEAELQQPDASIVTSGLFSHKTKDFLQECIETANTKLKR